MQVADVVERRNSFLASVFRKDTNQCRGLAPAGKVVRPNVQEVNGRAVELRLERLAGREKKGASSRNS